MAIGQAVLTPAAVRRWDPAGLDAAFHDLRAARTGLEDLGTALHDARPPDRWWGAAADAARRGHDGQARRLEGVTAAAAIVQAAVADAADRVLEVRAELARADDLAAALGVPLAADGTVADPHAAPDERSATARAEVAALLDGALRRAAQLDADLAAALRRAAAELLAAAAGPAPPAPPAGGGPAAHAAWWHGLGAAGREEVLRRHPGWVGGLDGVPAAARDTANRTLLAERIARADGAELAALTAVARAVQPAGRQLLLLDTTGPDQPRAAVAVGDVDTADHVAVFTPGFTTTVAGDLENWAADVHGVQQTAQNQLLAAGRPGETVAAVAWLGYDAPQWGTLLDPAESVASSAPAREGGRDLAGFLDGIGAARADDPHLTALGHSYGSTTTGYALQLVAADDAVLFGSPGAGTADLEQLGVPDGHVGVLEARRDAVADLGRFGGDTNRLDGAVLLSARDETGPDGRPLRESVGHSDYLAPGTTSQHNIAATVAGLSGHRITGAGEGLGDLLRNGPGGR